MRTTGEAANRPVAAAEATIQLGVLARQARRALLKWRWTGAVWLAGLLWAAPLGRAAESLPPLSQAMTTKATLIIEANLEAAAGSPVWQALKAQAPAMGAELKSLPGVPGKLLEGPSGLLTALPVEQVAEVLVVLEEPPGGKGLSPQGLDPNAGVLALLRLVKSADARQVFDQVLQALDKQKPGLRSQLLQGKSQVGAADVYDLPASALGATNLPFPLSAAAGAGPDGGVLAVGKGQSVRDYVSGRTDGQLPLGARGLLKQPGHLWLYGVIPEGATRDLAASGAMPGALPPGLGASLDKLRALGLGLRFEASQLDVELAVGCVDAGAAQQIADGLQGIVGMMQMAGSQRPGAVPGFLANLKLAAAGPVFRVNFPVTTQDLAMAMQSANRSAAAAPRAVPKSEPGPAPAPAAETPAVELSFLRLVPGEGNDLREVQLRIVNRAAKAVRSLSVTFRYFDGSGFPLKEWTTQHSDPDGDKVVGANATRDFPCYIFKIPEATARITATLRRAVFSDGTTWVPAQ